ncbi:MAG: hypothetical protein ABSH08_06215 [Tepidisphaeraceae bacterium]|jgi:hypothetical protein
MAFISGGSCRPVSLKVGGLPANLANCRHTSRVVAQYETARSGSTASFFDRESGFISKSAFAIGEKKPT